MEQLRAVIIGVGHLRIYHAKKYYSLPDINITAIIDANREHAESVASRFGATAYTNYREILDQVDLVSIVTPTELHYQIAKDCLKSHLHTLIENPITQTVSQAQALIDLAESNGVVLQVGHLERSNPGFQVIKEQLHNP